MKQLAILVILFSVISFGQIQKGMYRLGGGISYSTNSNSEFLPSAVSSGTNVEISRFDIRLNPTFAFMVSDHFEIGGAISYNYWEQNTEYSSNAPFYFSKSKFVVSSFGIGPTLRYYFTPKEKLVPFVDGNIFIAKNRGEEDSKFDLGVKGGINFFFAETAALEPFIGYDYVLQGNDTEGFLNLGIGFNVFIK